MNFLDIFKKNTTVDSTGILSEPGDKLEARVTNSVLKLLVNLDYLFRSSYMSV